LRQPTLQHFDMLRPGALDEVSWLPQTTGNTLDQKVANELGLNIVVCKRYSVILFLKEIEKNYRPFL